MNYDDYIEECMNYENYQQQREYYLIVEEFYTTLRALGIYKCYILS